MTLVHPVSASESLQIAEYARRMLPLADMQLSSERCYRSLTLCVIDAVFSINARYSAVENVVSRYCTRFHLSPWREDFECLPARQEQDRIEDLCRRYEDFGIERMADEVFCNRQRTSSRSGILKAEAVGRFAEVLHSRGMDCLQDVPKALSDSGIEADVRGIPGQGSGLSLRYFWMLCGVQDRIKPDRMILRFLRESIGRGVASEEAEDLMRAAARLLQAEFPHLTPLRLDHLAWMHESSKAVSE